MFKKLICLSVMVAGCSLLVARSVHAHPLDVAYLDFGTSTSSRYTLTAALHPYQAFELVRGGSTVRFDLAALQQRGDLITAYVQDHVDVSQDGEPCTWLPDAAHTPPTELEAVGDGVTIAGNLSCPANGTTLSVGSTVFLDGFPSQTSILRLDLPDGYADRVTLDHSKRRADLDTSELFVSQTTDDRWQTTARRPDAPFVEIATRLLDPGLGLWGFIGLLASAIVIGALHALGPGHGKSLLAATFVGEKATARHLLALGTVMTVTHVSDVFLMTLAAGFISTVLPPTSLLQFLEFISALGLALLGLFGLLRAIRRYRQATNNPSIAEAEEAHQRAHKLGLPHDHAVAEAHEHDHAPTSILHPPDFRRALWTGFIGSLAPCPTAWAIFLATVSVGRAGTGALLLVAFTIGLYATVLAVGALVLKSKAFALRHTSPRVTYFLPIISSGIITSLGIAFLIRGI